MDTTHPSAPNPQLAKIEALVASLSKQERAVWHWYVFLGASWRQTVRELGLMDKAHLESIFKSIDDKTGLRCQVIRKQRDEKIRERLVGVAA